MRLPEELLARILSLAQPNQLAPLLVSKQFLRIASPLFYHTLRLHSPQQTSAVLDTLQSHPVLARSVRRLLFAGIYPASAALLALCDLVCDVDISLDAGPALPAPDPDADAFCLALEQCPSIVHLTIRKDPAVYLTHPRPTYVLQRLALAVRQWPNLETVHFALRISVTSSTLPLARVLSVAPRLRSVRAQLPAVWNSLLLVISTNPRLEKVMLYTEPIMGPIPRLNQSIPSAVINCAHPCDDIEHAVLGTSLYMMDARKHARLSDLIRAGTAIIRTRATTIATVSSSSVGSIPLSVIRAKKVAAELIAIKMNHDSTNLAAENHSSRHSRSPCKSLPDSFLD